MKDFLDPLGMSVDQLPRESGISRTTVMGLVNGKMSVTPEITMRRSNFFGTSAKVWLGLQMS